MWSEDEEETITPASSPVFPVTSVPSSRRRRRPRRRHPKVTEQTPVVSESDCVFHATSEPDRLGQYSIPQSAVFHVRNSERNSKFENDCVSRSHNVSKFTSAPIKHETEFIAPLETAFQADLKDSDAVNSVRVIPGAVNSVSGNSGSVNPEPALPTLTPMLENDCFSVAPPRSAVIYAQTDNLTFDKQKTICELHTRELNIKTNSPEVPLPAETGRDPLENELCVFQPSKVAFSVLRVVSDPLPHLDFPTVFVSSETVSPGIKNVAPFKLTIADAKSGNSGFENTKTVHSMTVVKFKGNMLPSVMSKLLGELRLNSPELVSHPVTSDTTCVNTPTPVPAEYETVEGVPSLLDYAAHQPAHLETVHKNASISVTAPSEPRLTDPRFVKPGSFCTMTVLKTATSNMDSLRTAELLKLACHRSLFAETVFGSTNLVFPVSVTAPELSSPPPVPVPRAARAQLSLAPVSVPRVRVAEVHLVPASVSSLAEDPFIPAPVPAPRVGLMDTQPLPAPIPAPRVRSAVTLPTPAPVSVPRVGAAEIQLAPAPTPAPRIKTARAQLVPAPVSVPRVGMAGVRPGPAPVPVPRRRAAKSQTPAQSPVQLPADPPSLQPPPQLALLSIAQSLSQLLAQFPVLSPVQSLVQLLAQSPALLKAQQPIQSLPTSTGSLCELSQPAEDCMVLTHLGQTVCPAQPQPLHPKPTACPVQLQLASAEPEVSAPAGSASLLAGGSGEPLQPSLVSAGGSGEPLQPSLISAGGSGEPLQPSLHFLISAGGSGEPLQPLLVSAGGSGQPGQHLLVSAGGSKSPSPGSASASAPPTPSSGPAPSSPVAATPPSGPASFDPMPTKSQLVRPTLESRRRLPRGRPPDPLCSRRLPRGRPPDPLCSHRRRLPRCWPPDPLCGRRRLPRGRPPDPLCSRCRLPRRRPPVLFCCHCHFSRGRPPEQSNYELLCCRPPG
ncbi:endonuclease domain-containing 1 protein [Sarotherodon galilaeus]